MLEARGVGYVLITGGFLVGSYLAVRQEEGILLGPFLVALIVGAIGVALVRAGTVRAARRGEVLAENIEAIETSLDAIVEAVDDLESRKADIHVSDLRHLIDDLFPPHLDAFVRARKSIAHRYGLQEYADVMNPFAAAERSLNRVWSASTDGYVDEAHEYLRRARSFFRETRDRFRELSGSPA